MAAMGDYRNQEEKENRSNVSDESAEEDGEVLSVAFKKKMDENPLSDQT